MFVGDLSSDQVSFGVILINQGGIELLFEEDVSFGDLAFVDSLNFFETLFLLAG